MKNTDNFHYAKEAIVCNQQITIFTISKDEWNTKEDIGMSMKNAMYVLLGWSDTEQRKIK